MLREGTKMPRGRNSKRSVLKDDARERKIRETDALALETASAVIQQRFTREAYPAQRLEFLAAKIREGSADHTDFFAEGPQPDLLRADD
jgi:hypothetical protein